MRVIGLKVLILIFLLETARNAPGKGLTPKIPSSLVIDRFHVAKNGDCLLVPVRIAEKDHLFVVDTGAAMTAVDTSLPLGQPVGSVNAIGAQGNVEVMVYNPPKATVGRLSLGPLESVVGKDLSPLRQASGYPIEGVLGMDFLGKYVIYLDMNEGDLFALEVSTEGRRRRVADDVGGRRNTLCHGGNTSAGCHSLPGRYGNVQLG